MNYGFFSSAVDILQTLVVAIGAGLAVWGVINLLEGYGNDNPGAKSQGIKTAYERRGHYHCGADGDSTAFHTVLIRDNPSWAESLTKSLIS